MNHLHLLQQANLQRRAREHALATSGMTHAPVVAQVRATKLTGREILAHLTPLRHCIEQARKGKLTESQWVVMCTAANVGRAIDDLGVVRGFGPQLDDANAALQAMNDRATQRETQPWQPPTLRATELAAIREMATLYAFQLKQLSYGEYQQAFHKAIARVRSSGGRVDEGDTYHHAGLSRDEATPN